MQRYTISLEDGLAAQFEAWIRKHRYENRSEAIRDLLRDRFSDEALSENDSGDSVGCVSYVYDHHQRELGRRLAQGQHEHHELAVSTLHVHLDADQCLEVALLRGATAAVREQAQQLIAERGVRHGRLHLLPVSPAAPSHEHAHAHGHPHRHHHGHGRLRPPPKR